MTKQTHGSLAREIIENNPNLFLYLRPLHTGKGFDYKYYNRQLDKEGLNNSQMLKYIYGELAKENMDNASTCNGVLKAISAELSYSVTESRYPSPEKPPAPPGYSYRVGQFVTNLNYFKP